MYRSIVSVIVFVVIGSLFSLKNCSGKVDQSKYRTELSEYEVDRLNKSLLLSEDYSLFLPENMRNHGDIREFFEDFIDDHYELSTLTQEVLNSVEYAERTNSTYGLSPSPSLWKQTKKPLVEERMKLEKEFTKLYSEELNDSIRFICKQLKNYEDEISKQYFNELKQIRLVENYRNSPFLEHRLHRKLGIFELYKTLNKIEANRRFIQFQLVLNSFRHVNQVQLIEQQKSELVLFLQSEKHSYKSPVTLFEPMSRLISSYKATAVQLRERHNQNIDGYSKSILTGIEKTINLYTTAIEIEIKSIKY